MSENELCEKCKEEIVKHLHYVPPWSHCHRHHEPKEKLVCWCETWTFPDVINLTDSGNRTFKPKYCPECGRKLTKED